MVNARAEELSRLSDRGLVCAIRGYFRENATMPGEKAVKDYAFGKTCRGKTWTIDRLTISARKELIEEFSPLCVKEVKLKDIRVANETKKNAGTTARKASDLPMVLKATNLALINTMKNVYEMPASISDDGRTVCIKDGNGSDFILASIPEGFAKNHRTLGGMEGTVIATDHSNGKFANMSYTLLVDLGQRIQSVIIAA